MEQHKLCCFFEVTEMEDALATAEASESLTQRPCSMDSVTVQYEKQRNYMYKYISVDLSSLPN